MKLITIKSYNFIDIIKIKVLKYYLRDILEVIKQVVNTNAI